jgi:hypothetical protein
MNNGGQVIPDRAGSTHELPHAIPLREQLPGVPKWVVGDYGYTSHIFREHIWSMGAGPAILPQHHEAPVACPEWIYTNRNQVERVEAQGVESHRTPIEKTASSFMGVLCLAATLDWLSGETPWASWLPLVRTDPLNQPDPKSASQVKTMACLPSSEDKRPRSHLRTSA